MSKGDTHEEQFSHVGE